MSHLSDSLRAANTVGQGIEECQHFHKETWNRIL